MYMTTILKVTHAGVKGYAFNAKEHFLLREKFFPNDSEEEQIEKFDELLKKHLVLRCRVTGQEWSRNSAKMNEYAGNEFFMFKDEEFLALLSACCLLDFKYEHFVGVIPIEFHTQRYDLSRKLDYVRETNCMFCPNYADTRFIMKKLGFSLHDTRVWRQAIPRHVVTDNYAPYNGEKMLYKQVASVDEARDIVETLRFLGF